MTDLATDAQRTSILIVDDRAENLLALEGWLDDFDLDIVKAASGKEALERMLEKDFALVLMDVQMPGMDGFDTAALMKGAKRTRQVPIIFITAISKEDRHIFKGYETGAVDYISKPFDPHILRSKVSVFVRLHQQRIRLKETVDELRMSNESNKQLSIRDALTGCFNRRYLDETLPKEIKRARRYEKALSLILADIDHFKRVNDTHGHQCGDCVLRVFGNILQSRIRKDIDWVSRYGGEEFVVVLPETGLEGGATTAERLRNSVAEIPISYRDREIAIKASFGVAALDSIGTGPEEAAEKLLQVADKRLYDAKKRGRNRVISGK